MPTAVAALAIARSDLESDGSQENAWYGTPQGTEWCAIFVSWVLFHAGFTSLPGQTTARGFAFVPFMETSAKNAALWQDPSSTPQPGWSIVYDWNGDRYPDHVGFVEYVDSAGNVHTIEGNAPDPQTREIEVERHIVGPIGDRSHSLVLGYIAWPYDSSGEQIVPKVAPRFSPPIHFVSDIVDWQFTPDHSGVRMLTDDGHVYELGCTHFGSPYEDPNHDNWISGDRHAATLTHNALGGFVVTDTAGEKYGPYGPH